MNYKSIADLATTLRQNLHRIPRDVEVIVGVPRSGLLLANMISLELNLPLTDVDAFIKGNIYQSGITRRLKKVHASNARPETWKKVLIVDDSVASGRSLNVIKDQLSTVKMNVKIIYLVAYVLAETKALVDIYFEEIKMPRMFEWNVLHHPLLKYCCVDIDGVLCEDPYDWQNDDGKEYSRFIKNAVSRHKPTHPIGWIVTSRLEKYRNETKEWLDRLNIDYGQLLMLDVPDAVTRRKANKHASFKAEVYKSTDSILFIESEEHQAVEISSLSGKPVLCMTNQNFFEAKKITYLRPHLHQTSIFGKIYNKTLRYFKLV